MTAWIHHIGKNHRRTAKNVILEFHAGVYRHVVLDLYAVTDDDVRRDHHVLTDVAFFTYSRSAHYVGKMPYLGTLTDFAGRIDVAGLVHKVVVVFHIPHLKGDGHRHGARIRRFRPSAPPVSLFPKAGPRRSRSVRRHLVLLAL